MVNIEIMIENWCEEKRIDIDKIPDEILRQTENRIDDDFDNFLREKGKKIVDEWCWMFIEQELEDNPEWKIKELEEKGE